MNLSKLRIANHKVKVINNTWCYEYNKKLFEKLNFKNLQYNKKFENGTVATAIKLLKYDIFNTVVVKIVDEYGNECLIDYSGIQLI